VAARHDDGGGGWCDGVPRQRRCSGGRPWLGGGPTTPEEKGDSEGRLHLGGAQAVLTMERGWRRCLGEISVKRMFLVVGNVDK
jgi:hypothetical protein